MKSDRRIRLPHSAITRSSSLLPMMYSISELCEELNISRHLMRSWLQNGLPHHKDQNRIWIYGREFDFWITEIRQNGKQKEPMKLTQAYCFRCRQRIEITNPKDVFENGNYRRTGTCPQCGGMVNRGIQRGQSKKFQTCSGISEI